MESQFSPKAGIFIRLGQTTSLAAVLIFGWYCPLQAESNLKIAGQILDSLTGLPIGGAAVEVVEASTRTTSGIQGEFFIYDLPSGAYRLKVESSSHQSYIASVKVLSDGAVAIEIRLSPIAVTGPLVVVLAALLSEGASQPSLTFERADLQKSKHLSVAEFLSRQSGMDFKASGASGSTEEVTIRGSAANQVLVLLDGRPLNSNLGGTADLSLVPVEALEKIEVYKGSHTARFGPDAVAGAIALISKKPEGRKRMEPKFQSEIGSFGHRSVGGETNLPANSNTEAYILYQNLSAKGDFDYTNKNQEQERQGSFSWSNRSSGNLRHKNLETSIFWAKARRGLPGDVLHVTPLSSERDERLGASVRFRPAFKAGWFLEPELSWEKLTQQFRIPDPYAIPYDTRYRSEKKKLQGRFGRRYSKGLAQISLDYSESSLDGKDYLRPTRSLGKTLRKAGGAGLLSERQFPLFSQLTFGTSGALRSDWTDFTTPAYSPLFSGSLYWRKKIKARIFGSWGKSFRRPTLDALFWKEDVFTAGNPNLLPERAESREAGYRLTFPLFGRLNVEQAFFHNDLKNLIIWQRNFEGKFTPQNVSKAKIFGREERISWQFSKILELEFNHTQTEPINESGFILHRGKQLVFRPRHIHNARVSASYSSVGLNLTGRWVGKRFTRAENTKYLPSYETYDAQISKTRKIWKLEWNFSLAVENFTDQRYELLELYPMPGRSFKLGVEAKW